MRRAFEWFDGFNIRFPRITINLIPFFGFFYIYTIRQEPIHSFFLCNNFHVTKKQGWKSLILPALISVECLLGTSNPRDLQRPYTISSQALNLPLHSNPQHPLRFIHILVIQLHLDLAQPPLLPPLAQLLFRPQTQFR